MFIVLKTICAPRELMNGRKISLRRSESQHWPGSCCNNWRNKVNVEWGGGEETRGGDVFIMIDSHWALSEMFFMSLIATRNFKIQKIYPAGKNYARLQFCWMVNDGVDCKLNMTGLACVSYP